MSLANAAPTSPSEADLQAFLARRAPPTAARIRTLAHAWTLAGGSLALGRFSVRLIAPGKSGSAYTAGTLHAKGTGATLELSRVLLLSQGLSPAAWQAWCDERVALRDHGFDADAKFPTVNLDELGDVPLLHLAQGLRDLARLAIAS